MFYGKLDALRWCQQSSVIGLGCLLLGCATVATSDAPTAEDLAGPGQILPVTAYAEIAEQRIQLEVAETPQQQGIGFMYRTRIPEYHGMLFPFERPRQTAFWMKNVPISLDMIFLRGGRVQAIASDVPPCAADPCPVYGPGNSVLVDQVIELRGGQAAELGVQPGDAITVVPLESGAEVTP